ncbi:MAG: ATP-grasp domain-containing protein [Bacteroidales bacterium]|nr:ATP-grasp domain-containing protein [Bacteroidales bacterium]MCI5483449.1 ATP-grasp domain-containing protein [Bacteroidales bacterium]MDD6751249.1 ATP-grasp domain-containing protein [Bacteroidales bacterium]MDY2878834.1 ATP-grasp domain-containing protein [Candidatus Cryptobacteroides sp.]
MSYSNIAVIYGSDSSESEVSCRSGEFVASRIDGSVYGIYEIYARFGKWQLVACKDKNSMRITFPEGSRPEVDKNEFAVSVLGRKVRFDYAYIVQHGAPGESGQMEGYLEMLGIPFSTCSSQVSAVAFDKFSCKCQVRDFNVVKCAPDAYIRKGADLEQFCRKVNSSLRYPVFVKPTQAGSSFGVTRVTDPSALASSITYAFSECPGVLVEQSVSGRELTCAAYFDGSKVVALPLIEIVTENEYFDYDAKYNGHSSEICPAPVDDSVRQLVQQTTTAIYSSMGCKGVVRMDFILAEDGLYFLEINTIPGMTSASLVPKMVRTAGIDMTQFLTTIIENS